MISDCLVCEINDDAIQMIARKADLIYARAIELAQSQEIAVQNMKELKVKIEGSENRQLPQCYELQCSTLLQWHHSQPMKVAYEAMGMPPFRFWGSIFKQNVPDRN